MIALRKRPQGPNPDREGGVDRFSKPRRTGIEDISEAKRTMKTTHIAPDAV
ncbi:hypothetical protein ThimaDRAFT_3345 [Thiocapsa marina 5811]|uniref:Uncharacterized protein n=1 Tax=Thiocapsa marina 5811 TaxID=768671 RepID=F9UEJ2_9GAMM|nr:hypothetical protein ThimaDRAFT_3345 [Thiocapsa marina 5811]